MPLLRHEGWHRGPTLRDRAGASLGLSTWDMGDGIEVQHDERTGAFSGLSTILAGDEGMYLDPPQRVGRYTFG